MKDLDRATILEAQAGCPEAYARVIRHYQAAVLSTIHRLVGGHHRADVEDLGQELFVKLHRSIGRFDLERGVKFSTWLFTAVKNLCYDHLRKRRLPVESIDGLALNRRGERAEIPIEGAEPPPEAKLASTELGERIADAVESLPRDQRLVFVLREYQNFSYEEIGHITGATIGTVKSRLFRAKEALRQKLFEYLRV
jgi:RNA polymerase sigma-70 factor (ECF subfamily)